MPILTRRNIILEGLIFAHLFLLGFFCLKAASSVVWKRAVMPANGSVRVATYNLRFDSMPDNITVQQTLAALPDPLTAPPFLGKTGEQPWSTRRIKVWQDLMSEGVVLFGIQEGLVRQVNDLATLLGSEWAWIGVGRDDGKQAGEFSAIFYNKNFIELREWDTFWLSNTPFDVSRFPGAGSLRICTAARMTLKTTSGPINFSYLNTHLDDQSDGQRRLGASLILQRARFEAFHSQGGPVIVTGDFNSPSTGTDSGAYMIATGALPPEPINATFAQTFAVPNGTLTNFVLDDLKAKAPRANVGGNFATFTGFNPPGDTASFTRIDFVFGGSNGKWTATQYKVGTSLTDDGVLASDHRPVFADITLQ